jgi:ribonuclease Z
MYPESEQATRLVILGTGNAMATRCYNTCFALCPPGGDILLVDAGGGNGIFRQMEAAALPYERVRHLYLTHGHTDHALGMIWVLRKITALMCAGRYEGDLHVHCHSDAAALLRTVCTLMLPGKYTALFDQRVRFHIVADGEQADLLGMAITFFDIHSTKLRQFGFAARLPSGLRLACLGDEPFNPLCGRYVEGCGLLMSEAFCLYADRERFRPYEKHHSTALDAGRIAASLGAESLLLYHTEDETLATRRARYVAEAASVFPGRILVPDDLDAYLL